ncbi:DUF1010 domain-containing protein [Ectopseudomonas oleovorans]
MQSNPAVKRTGLRPAAYFGRYLNEEIPSAA